MHPLFARQLAEATGPDGSVDLVRLGELVGGAYGDDERARVRLERAMRLMSEEMEEAAREQVAQVATRARESVSRYILKSGHPLVVTSAAGAIILANAAFATLVGADSARALAGRDLADFFTDAAWYAVVLAGDPPRHPTTLSRPDGSCVQVQMGRSEVSIGGAPILILSIRDETGRLRREEALESARLAAEQANAAKSSFLAMMSHELRTPLNALLGAADLLRRTPLDDTQSGYVRMFNEAGRLMLALVNDVLDYSKIEAGQLEIESQPLRLSAMTEEVAAMWSDQAAEKGLALEIVADTAGADWVLGDPMRLRQILFNLVSNALKFTAAGGVRIRLSSSASGGAVRVVLSVRDTGVGIPADRMEAIFKPFVQADSSITRKFGGTGLGLSIARSLARHMGGDLRVESEPGVGTLFELSVALPQACETSAVAGDEAALEDCGRLSVLAVDDNELNRRILAAILGIWNIEATWATNGVEALECLERAAFDLVLMDVQMPVMDGLTATRRLRASAGPNRDVPVIALTANAREEDRAACLAAGMSDFLTKPIKPEALMAALVKATEAEAAVCLDKSGTSG